MNRSKLSQYFSQIMACYWLEVQKMQYVINTVTNVSREYDLEVNKNNSSIIIFNMRDKPIEIKGIKVANGIKYLGMRINNKRNCFKIQNSLMMEKAAKMANMTYPVIAKSCSRLLIGKTYWKSVA